MSSRSWSKLRGQMSLVGPRPPLPSAVETYGNDVRQRLLVKPGMTGLWQINGRSDLTWDEVGPLRPLLRGELVGHVRPDDPLAHKSGGSTRFGRLLVRTHASATI
jgi:hypothetical protein